MQLFRIDFTKFMLTFKARYCTNTLITTTMATIIEAEEIAGWEKYYRINILNKISGFRTACLIGTSNSAKNTNLAMFNSVTHIGSNPFFMGFILRPTTVERHTYNNIKETNYFTINHVNSSIYKQAHQTSAKYAESSSEFKKCHLTETYIDNFKAPFVKESVIKVGLSFAEEQLIRSNQTRLIIGKVEKLIIPDNSINANGDLRLDMHDSVIVNGLDTYYKAYFLEQLEFARP